MFIISLNLTLVYNQEERKCLIFTRIRKIISSTINTFHWNYVAFNFSYAYLLTNLRICEKPRSNVTELFLNIYEFFELERNKNM